jgi:hypothetical protein
MIPTRSPRLLLLCALAFSVGTPVSSVLAQQSSNDTSHNASAGAQQPRANPRVRGNARQPGLNVTRSSSQPARPVTTPTPAPTAPTNPSLGSTPSGVQAAELPPPPPADRRTSMRGASRSSLQAPTTVRVARAVSTGAISVTWTDPASTETGFIVQRQQHAGGRWTNAVEYSVPANSVFFEETVPAGVYAYRVATSQGSGRSTFSDWALIQVAAPRPAGSGANGSPTPVNPTPTPPGAGSSGGGNGGSGTGDTGSITPPAEAPSTPSGLVSSDLGDRSARVQWAGVERARTYRVERSPAFSDGVKTFEASVTSFVDASGAGTFRYRVRAIGEGGSSGYSDWSQIVVRDLIPTAPDQLSLSDLGNHDRVRLAWRDLSDNEYRFRIERESQSGDASATLRIILANANTSELVDFPGPGTHRYRIAAMNSAGVSASSPWSSITITAPTNTNAGDNGEPGFAPAAPGGILATSSSPRSVALNWTDLSSDEGGFEIERNPAFVDGVSRVSAGTTSFVDSVIPGDYAYRVRSFNTHGRSEFTPWVTVDVSDDSPAAPTGVVVSGSDDPIEVRWNDASSNEAGFEIVIEQLLGSVWDQRGSHYTMPNESSVVIKASPGTYRARVMAYNATGSSSSDWVGFTVTAPIDPMAVVPVEPSGVVVLDQSRRAAVMWSDESLNELGFEVERSPAFGSRVLVGANVGGHIDNCGPGTFNYRVRSYNNAGYSSWSGWASITIAETAPVQPTAVSALDAGNQRDVRISWVDGANNETGFRLERSSWTNGAWSAPNLETLAANTTSYIDTPGMGRFRYRVQAFNTNGDSGWSEYGSATITDGWTQVVKSADTREIFVSSSLGNDNNTGLTENDPIRTLSKAFYTVRDGMPDHVRLRRGDVWTGEQLANGYGAWDKHGRSASEPIVIYSYGNAEARPLIRAGQHGTVMLVMGNDVFNGNMNLIGLHFQANRRMVGDPNFTPDEGATGLRWYGTGGNLLIEDCYFEGFTGNLSIESPLTANAPGSPITNWVRNIVIRRSVFADAYATNTSHSQGLYFSMVDGLLVDECVVDHNGWSTTVPNRPSTIFNHNFYVQPNVTNAMIRNTISARAAATAVQCRGRKQDVFNVLAIDSPLSITAGHGSTRMPDQAWTGTFSYNVTLGSRDIGVNNSLPRGFGMAFGTSNGGTLEKNIIAHNTTTVGGEPALSSDGVTQNSIVRDNIIYNWTGLRNPNQPNRGLAVRINGNPNADFRFENNTIQQPNGGTLIQIRNATESGTWARNKMYTTSPADIWFSRFGTGELFNMQSWFSRTGQSGMAPSVQDTVEQVTFPDPNRSVASYMQTLGFSGNDASTAKFLTEARKLSRNNWRPEFTAAAVNRYIREGFAMPEPPSNGGVWAAGEED